MPISTAGSGTARRGPSTGGSTATVKPRHLSEGDFTELSKPKLQTNALIFGAPGSGKTTFVTRYCPDPIAFINLDNRAEHALFEARGMGRIIHPIHIDIPTDVLQGGADIQKEAIGAVHKLKTNFEIAVGASLNGECRTICIDTGTEYSEVLTLAARGHLGKATDYGQSKNEVNQSWWHLFNYAKKGLAHLVVLARAKEVWKANQPTGKMKPVGASVMMDACDWAAEIRVREDRDGEFEGFEMKVIKSGINIAEHGEVYTDEDWEAFGGPFKYACMCQYQGTEESHWE